VLALRGARAANAVSELHGQVSRRMWQALYGAARPEDVPIGHITNGVHLVGWMKGTVRRVWKRRFFSAFPGKSELDWLVESNGRILEAPGRTRTRSRTRNLGSAVQVAARVLIEFARRRLLIQGHSITQEDFISYDTFLIPPR